jgi:predicted AAA+ superfamily ATPase
LTGSSAKLLSKDVSTEPRGRVISYEMFPFSIFETLQYQNLLNQYVGDLGFVELVAGSFGMNIGRRFENFISNQPQRKKLIFIFLIKNLGVFPNSQAADDFLI